jgi:hypothetical protein
MTTAANVTTLEYPGLTGDTAYQFTVKASNANGLGEESDKSAAVTVLGAVVSNAGPDQSIARRTTATTVTLDGSKSTKANATYKWVQTGGDKVTLSGDTTLAPTFTLPVFASPATNNPLTFSLSVTSGGKTLKDEVKVTPVPDRVTATATWKSRDFRIDGTGSTVGATVTVRRGGPTGTVIGRAPVTAAAAPETGGVWTLRLRDNAAGTNPGTIWVESNLGHAFSATVTAR